MVEKTEDKDKTVTIPRIKPAVEEPTEVTPYLLVLSGNSVGRVFKLSKGSFKLGRSVDAEIMIEDDGISRLHACITMLSATEVLIEDLDSTNGTFVDGDEILNAKLTEGQKIQLGTSTILKYSCSDTAEKQFVTKLYESATRDALTRAHNKAFLEDCLNREFAWHKRHNQPLTLILFDIDHFKEVNDSHGHTAGDQVLRALVLRCRRQLRTEDVFARWGGEEFACLLRQTTLVDASQFAERLRTCVENEPFEISVESGASSLPITISAGVAGFDPEVHEDADALLETADQRLYRAKAAGRNLVVSGG